MWKRCINSFPTPLWMVKFFGRATFDSIRVMVNGIKIGRLSSLAYFSGMFLALLLEIITSRSVSFLKFKAFCLFFMAFVASLEILRIALKNITVRLGSKKKEMIKTPQFILAIGLAIVGLLIFLTAFGGFSTIFNTSNPKYDIRLNGMQKQGWLLFASAYTFIFSAEFVNSNMSLRKSRSCAFYTAASLFLMSMIALFYAYFTGRSEKIRTYRILVSLMCMLVSFYKMNHDGINTSFKMSSLTEVGQCEWLQIAVTSVIFICGTILVFWVFKGDVKPNIQPSQKVKGGAS